MSETNKLRGDLYWTFGSFAVLASCGVGINIIITVLRDAKTLGVFNLAYSVYMIASQVSVWGVHYSALRHVSILDKSKLKFRLMLSTALVIVGFFGFFAAGLIYFISPYLSDSLNSQELDKALVNSLVGVALFPLNKVLLATFNGLQMMKLYSALQSARYLLVLILVALISSSELSASYLTISFSIAEAVIVVVALVKVTQLKFLSLHFSSRWFKRHLNFGSSGLLSGVMVEVNSRIDIFMLGALMNERAVGIYSFAAMLVDGAQHLLTVIRTNYNPLIARSLHSKRPDEVENLYGKGAMRIMIAFLVAAIMIYAMFIILTTQIVPEKNMQQGALSLFVMLFALWLISSHAPFDNTLLVAGYPGMQALQYGLVSIVNFTICILLIPHIGILGAAIGTSVGYLAGICISLILINKRIGVNLYPNLKS